jgi:hypothetical protein
LMINKSNTKIVIKFSDITNNNNFYMCYFEHRLERDYGLVYERGYMSFSSVAVFSVVDSKKFLLKVLSEYIRYKLYEDEN